MHSKVNASKPISMAPKQWDVIRTAKWSFRSFLTVESLNEKANYAKMTNDLKCSLLGLDWDRQRYMSIIGFTHFELQIKFLYISKLRPKRINS